ncbi:uncharacterized protein EV420DRAFT_1652632 [Desarmillaria tabescens]|uniref:Uncharacterized protein n=1 Tax=Armillaria tabescens TaxID=1929756 RepID=A0AA39MJX8_ARMTA|nr:uncharacterized protein EV420DRAFT_1652632 [Desarmillaria tabescens]KAK0436190.1 hypothetical protein EV420DRAFT_1652632 [Desarmillaria tabescens]
MGSLGLFKKHCHVVWGIDVQFEGGDRITIKTPPEDCSSNAILLHWISIINDMPKTKALKKQLMKATKIILWYICYDNDLPNTKTKSQLIDEIVGWHEVMEDFTFHPQLDIEEMMLQASMTPLP